ncbi:UDP-glycosyltransferase UGT5-like [Ischnura elegans]|uniref:UDP-glycosyltransferase UGT5-like n=1 Tax=Ischnura elegans TaxID=197161 RepID=UPI001ED8BC75|nr:UDP-glycosyltransferase UGT5-like [Ischnura elegans]
MAPSTMKLLFGAAVLIFGASLLTTAEASKILFAMPFAATSHSNVITALAKELTRRGHSVTVITPVPIKDVPMNYTQIDVSEIMKGKFQSPKVTDQHGVIETCFLISRISNDVCNSTLREPAVQELINGAKSGKGFDLVVVSMFYCECAYSFAHIFDTPLVLMSPAGSFPVTDSLVGNPAITSFVPDLFSSFSDNMNLMERTLNTLLHMATLTFHYTLIYPKHNTILSEVFGSSFPNVHELEKRVSLVLLNSHHSILFPRPMVPNLVEVGGIHVKPPKALPQDIKKMLDEAKNGVIYFSLGSNLKSADLPESMREALMGAFRELKQTVLWKWEVDSLPGQPANVKISKWWPQADILAHPNVKMFITHGGLLSFQEAVDRGVPLIGIPFYGDQDMNMKRVSQLGVGLKMDFQTITKEVVLENINTILKDQSFSKKMKDLSGIWKDRPESAMERAVYWIEYVLRHNGAKHMKSGAVELGWCQYYLIDVASILVGAVLLVLAILVFTLKFLFGLCKRKPTKKAGGKDKSSKQKKHQ